VKTISLKKVSAVAVASLGFGLLSAVPVQATTTANTTFVHSGTGATTAANFASSASVAVGTRATVNLTAGFTAGAAANSGADTITLTAALTTSPATTNGVAVNAIDAANVGATFTTVGTPTNTTPTGAAEVRTIPAAASGAVSTVQTLGYTPTVPGVYRITVTAAGTGSSVLSNGSLTHVFTIYAGYSIDAANANNAFATQGVNTTTGWSTTAGGVGSVRLTNYPATAAVRHFVTVTGGTILTATIQNNSNGANAITKLGGGDTTYTVNLTNGSNFTGGVDFVTGTSTTRSDAVLIQVQASTAGGNVTVTDTYYNAVTGAATVYATAVLTVGAASAVSAANSTSILSVDATTAATDDTINASAATGAQRGNVAITLLDQYTNAAYGQTLSATITGPGLIAFSQGTRATQGTAKVASLPLSASENTAFLGINGDGTGGVATIRILAGTTLVATETLTFYGTATVVSAKVIEPHIQVGTATSVIEVSAKDSTGQFGVGSFSAKSSDPSVVASTSALTCVQVTSGNFASYTKFVIGSYACSVTGIATGTTKLSINWDSLVTNTNTVVDIRVTKSVAATLTLTTDKATYAPGEIVTVTLTATDSDGYLIGKGASDIDWLGADSFASSSSAAVKAAGTDLTNAAFNLSAGKRTTQYYAPGTPGAVTYSATLSADAAVPAALRGTTLTAKATVTDSTAALATQIDALNAKIVALNALIAKIMKKLGVK